MSTRRQPSIALLISIIIALNLLSCPDAFQRVAKNKYIVDRVNIRRVLNAEILHHFSMKKTPND